MEVALFGTHQHLADRDAIRTSIGDYFSLRNGNPLNLENVLRDPRYSKVKFVLIHGGYPYTLDMIWLTAAKNVYTDSSLVGYYVYPSELKNILKQWISLFPERMMFGSDAFPFNDAVGAEEALDLDDGVGPVGVGVADGVVDALVGGQDEGVGGGLVEAGRVTHGLNEGPGQGQQAEVAGHGQRPGRAVGGHPFAPAVWEARAAPRGGTAGL